MHGRMRHTKHKVMDGALLSGKLDFNHHLEHNAIQKRKVHAVVPGGLCISAAALCIVCMHAWASVLGLGKAGCFNWVFYA